MRAEADPIAEPVKKKIVRVPIARCGLASKGQKISLQTNLFKMNVTNVKGHFFHYSIVLYASVINGLSSKHTAHASPVNGFQNTFPDDIGDDDLLENLDVDQIVMEHYQSSGTPQPSISKFLPFTNYRLMIQDRRDLFATRVVCELQSRFKGTHRLQLDKQIQELEKHLRTTSADEERKKSHFSTYTAAPRTFNYETPPTVAYRIDPVRLDSQFHVRNKPDGFDRWNSSFAVPPTPVEREPYIPKYVDVNYIEGSNDKMWSSREFHWTTKLEDNNKRVFGNHSFRPNQKEVINVTMS